MSLLSITPVLQVKNLAASRVFYLKLGFQIQTGSATHCILSLSSSKGSPEILLQESTPENLSESSAPSVTLRIKLDGEHGIDQYRQLLAELQPSEIMVRGWGQQHFIIRDPDGHVIEVSQAKPIYQG